MNIKQIGLALVLLDFAALTVYALVSEPPTAFFDAVRANWWGIQLSVDLCIALTFGGVWLWRDAKARGINPLPWVLALPLTGSLALLAYALRRQSAPARVMTPAAAGR